MWKQFWNRVMDRGWKSIEVHSRKNQYFCEEIFSGDSGESLERKEESWRERLYLLI